MLIKLITLQLKYEFKGDKMKIKNENETQEHIHENIEQHDQKPEESPLLSIQNWMSNHKLITGVAAVALMYLVGGRRIQQLTRFAVKSGIAAGITNAAMNVFVSKSAPTKNDESVLH